jgi:hypothetical protein
MKANELRVGNYVQLPFENNRLHIVTGYDIQFLRDGMDSNTMDGIKITEEWLLKLGFHEADRTGKYDDFSIGKHLYLRLPICKHSEKDYWYALRGDVKIKYVHQLQNLYFALTGEEL